MPLNTNVARDAARAARGPALEPAVLSIKDAMHYAQIGRSTIYRALAAGRLPRVKVGRKTLIPVAALRALVAPKDAAAA
jgi:excisionase family DNA binding protein